MAVVAGKSTAVAEISTHRGGLYPEMAEGATTISVKSAEMSTRKLVIVPPPQKSVEKPMPTPQRDNALQAYVLKLMRDEGLSYQDVETAATNNKQKISRGTIQAIATGDTTNPGIFTLAALAAGLNRPIEEVLRVTLGPLLPDVTALERSEGARILELAKQLPAAEQKFVKRTLQMLEREIKRILSGP